MPRPQPDDEMSNHHAPEDQTRAEDTGIPPGGPVAHGVAPAVEPNLAVWPERKPDPCRRVRIEALRRMTPRERLMQSFGLGRIAHTLFVSGLRKRFPYMPEEEFHRLMLRRIAKCYNQNW